MLDNTQSIICAFGLAAAAPRSPYRHLELCGIALTKTKGEPINGKETCNALHHGRLRLDPGRNLWQRRCCCQQAA
ncbi:MAG: hypothetical protein WA039_09165, partial [Gemmiger qucibialis]